MHRHVSQLIAVLLSTAACGPSSRSPTSEPPLGSTERGTSEEEEAPCGWLRLCNPLSWVQKQAMTDETTDGGCPVEVRSLTGRLSSRPFLGFSDHRGFIFDAAEEGEGEVSCCYRQAAGCYE